MDTTPTALRQIDPTHLSIRWSDGHEGRYAVRDVRLACRCAVCVNEMTGARQLDPAVIPAEIHPVTIRPVGNYALQITWSDGHATGIYRFDHLRALCTCEQCRTFS